MARTPSSAAFDFDSDVGPFPTFKRGKIGKGTTSVVPQGEEIRPCYHENKERHDTYLQRLTIFTLLPPASRTKYRFGTITVRSSVLRQLRKELRIPKPRCFPSLMKK